MKSFWQQDFESYFSQFSESQRTYIKHFISQVLYSRTEKEKAYYRNWQKRISLEPEYREQRIVRQRERRKTLEHKIWMKEYRQRPEVIAKRREATRRYNYSFRGIWNNKHYYHRKKGSEFSKQCLRCTDPAGFKISRLYG